jgi:hypothetical protein
MVNTLEKPEPWQKEYFVAWVGETDHEAALAQSNGWMGPIAEALKTHDHYAQVSLLCGGDVHSAKHYREWLLAQTAYSADRIEIWQLTPTDPDNIEALDRQVAARMVGRHLPYRSVVTCLLSSCSPTMAAIWLARAVLGYGERLVRTTSEGRLEAVTCRMQLLNECLPPWWRPGAVQRYATAPWRWPEESILEVEKLPINNILRQSKKRGLRHTGVNVHLLLVAEPDDRVQVQAFAQVVHARSAFARGPLLRFDCRSVPLGDIRAQLFGAEAEDGRFVSGAIGQAFGGTLILSELDAMSEVDQRMLLNILELHADDFRLIGTLSKDPRKALGPVTLCEALFDRLVEGILVG